MINLYNGSLFWMVIFRINSIEVEVPNNSPQIWDTKFIRRSNGRSMDSFTLLFFMLYIKKFLECINVSPNNVVVSLGNLFLNRYQITHQTPQLIKKIICHKVVISQIYSKTDFENLIFYQIAMLYDDIFFTWTCT